MGKEWLFLYDGGNLLVWCRWQGAQTSDAVKNSAGVSRAGRFCLSFPVLQIFIHLSSSVPLLIQSERDWFNYRRPVGLILIGLSYFFRVVDWNIYTVRKQKEWWCGWVIQDLFTVTSLKLTEFYQYGQLYFWGSDRKRIIGPHHWTRKKVDRIILLGELRSNQH